MNKITKAIIPVAGLGTRFLPATKAVPKELLPIVDKPTLQYIIEEAAASGIEEVLLVTSAQKPEIGKHFAKDVALEDFLRAHGKDALCEKVAHLSDIVTLSFVNQEAPLGLGHAVSLGRDFAAGEAVAVLLGDDVVAAEPPALAQLIQVYEETGASVLGVQTVAEADVSKYGIVAPGEATASGCIVQRLVEKPAASEAPSNLAIMGRYVITPPIFDLLDDTAPGKGGEIQLTDALNTLAGQENVYACAFSGRRYDVGSQLGFLEANVEFGLARADIGEAFKDYLRTLCAHLD
ncbi:MAG: UTP--glucose-1-phosphate uridylyltransferase GalU [Peptococcaceae bacterium]|nr:UTP--glucose-1-phosphate uridylyltransferase GalU [Peptococcaceae bacterium]